MKQKTASTEEVAFLFDNGAIKKKVTNALICSLPLLCFAISKTKGKGYLVPSLLELGRGL